MHNARPAFFDALMPFLDSDVVKFNKRCVSVGLASSGRQLVHFADNTSCEADLVIGADGIKSIIRNAVVSDPHLCFSNTYAYRGLIPINILKLAGVKTDVQSRPLCWVGLGMVHISLLENFESKLILNPIKHIVTFPVKQNTIVCVLYVIRELINHNEVECSCLCQRKRQSYGYVA